jgi:hypothetical protein
MAITINTYCRVNRNGSININTDPTFPTYIPPPIVTDGLVLYLDAGNSNSYPGSGTTWSDISGNGYNGTLTNGPTFNSANGGGIVFDGTNDYVIGNNNLNSKITTAITISVFAKVPNMNSRVPLFFKYQAVSLPYGYSFEVGTINGLWTRTMRFYAAGNIESYASDYRGDTELLDNTIYMFTAQYSNTQSIMKMYYNTTEMPATQDNPNWENNPDWSANTNAYVLGAADPAFNIYGSSTIYNTLVYNRILSLNEITQNYNAYRSRFGL